MMDFLRRLAPPRDGDRSRAMAVLPSRFASEAPLRSVPNDAVSAADEAPASPVAMPRAARAEPARPTQAIAAPPAPHKAFDPVTIAVTPLQPAGASERPTTARVVPSQPTRLVQRSVISDAPDPPRRRDPAPVAAEPPRHVPAAPATTMATARPAITLPPTRPLSPQAMAARTTPPEPPRPVIHVTIDHIDVRAPTPPARAPAPAQPRATTPSVSLADYLRGGRR